MSQTRTSPPSGGSIPNPLPVTIVSPIPLPISGTVTADQGAPGAAPWPVTSVAETIPNATVTTIPATDLETLFSAATPTRREIRVLNRGNRRLYLKDGAGIIPDGPLPSFSQILDPGQQSEPTRYQGNLFGVWDSDIMPQASGGYVFGVAVLTEVTT